MSERRDLSPREARDRFIDRRRAENTDHTIRSYENRLTRFVEWAEDADVESMGNLDGWDLDEFRAVRQHADISRSTLRGEMMALKQLLDYCAGLDVVGEDLVDKLDIPTLDKREQSSDKKLAHDDARRLLTFYRDSTQWFGTPQHTLLEVSWHVGPRMGGLQALDLKDFDAETQTLRFRHRPPETPLKNKADGERVVGISEEVVEAIETYVARERFDKRDAGGREPLFSCRQGRPSKTTFRSWSYLGTQPCLAQRCPHGEERPACTYVHRNHASKCPSSRALHAVRTGSITWQYLQGVDVEDIGKRVNATPETVRKHYLKPELVDEFEQRRAETTLSLDIQNDDE